MDPTIAGALIAGSAAVVGFGASAWNTSRTIRASRRAAREQLVWDKRSELYIEMLESVIHRRQILHVRSDSIGEKKREELKMEIESYVPPNGRIFDARIRAFASVRVQAEFATAHKAGEFTEQAYVEQIERGSSADRASGLKYEDICNIELERLFMVELAIRTELQGGKARGTRPGRVIVLKRHQILKRFYHWARRRARARLSRRLV
jgi:hypothetical protein